MDLKILGLNSYEERAYLTLIKLGKTTASRIAQESEVPYGKIYPTLESLESKGLILVIPEKTKKFIASDPENLIELLRKKQSDIEDIEKELVKMRQIYIQSPKEPITIIKGQKNFYKVVQEMPVPKKYEYDIKHTSETKPEWIRDLVMAKKKRVDVKILTRYDDETKTNVKRWLRYTKNIKKIPNKGVAVAIIDDKFMFITMINSNITIIVHDKATIALFKELFENYYKNTSSV